MMWRIWVDCADAIDVRGAAWGRCGGIAGVRHPTVLLVPTDRAAIASTPAGMLPHGLPV
jgi:hypothetical protein